MKRIIIFLFILCNFLFVFSCQALETSHNTFESGVTFDWISKSQLQRDENIKYIQSLLFSKATIKQYDKKSFKSEYAPFFKNKNFANDYDDVSNGKKEDEQKNYCGFFYKNLLVAYGVQYKNNMNNVYYYDAMGNLRWLDTFSEKYPVFPYWSYQYDKHGKMVAAFYYLSDYDQYIFTPDKKFKGRWYKDKMYNRNAKVILTRSNYGEKN